MKTYFDTYGKGQNIVLLHGGGIDYRYMEPLVEHLHKRFCVINVHLPGAGLSPWDHPKSIHDIADKIAKDMPQNAIYIGWSIGGMIAAAVAARHPNKVQRLIGITTSPKFVESENWPGVPASGFKVGYTNINNQDEFITMLNDFVENEFTTLNPKPNSYQRLLEINQASPVRDLDGLKESIDIADAADLREDYKVITCPVDLILTENDGAVPLEAHKVIKNLNENIIIHVIPNAPHAPFWTHPKEFFLILDNILKET